jgi:DNA invertase Pin-like site-specific DNA recombinase
MIVMIFILQEEQMKKKVAAYCRVSTKEDIQRHSLEAQKVYYKRLIEENVNYEFVGIYADTSSGLRKKNRVQFEKMLRACKRGEIDIIYTKSISRFARNTLDFLKVIRDLKFLGVDVYFQNEYMWLQGQRSERDMTLHAALAQEESIAKSRGIRWGLTHGFESGTSKLANRVCYGYTNDKEGNLVIDEEKAKNVRLIFDLYLHGYSLSKIVKELKERGVLSPTGKESWTSMAIDKILTNEKYVGNVILQKTYIPDVLKQKQKKNEGEVTRYLYENNHVGIIDQAIFEAVQKERSRRTNVELNGKGKTVRKNTRFTSNDSLSGKIQCGECGRNFRRITTHSGEIVWRCAGRVEKNGTCKARTVKQSEIDEFIKEGLYNEVIIVELSRLIRSKKLT